MTYRDYTITPEEVAMLREVRRLQKAFFRGDKTVVGQAKGKEREMDQFLAQFPDPKLTAQTELFEEAA